MLSARYLASCSDDLVRLYAEFETQIIQDMARRLAKIGAVSDSTLYQAEIYKEIGGLKKDISNLLSKYDPQTQKILNKLFNEAIEKATEKDMSAFNAAKRELSENQKQIISATAEKVSSAGIVSSNKKVREEVANGGAIKTFSGLQRLTMTIADTASSDFVQQANFAYMQVISGAFTGDFALKNSVKNLAEKGVYTVEYTDSGKTIYRSIESAVRSNIITGINQTCNQITLDNCEATGTDLVEVSAHLGARNVDRDGRPWANHAEWQGKIYSLTGGRNYVDADGNVKYAPDFYETCRPGEPDGIGGVNCRHSFYPYFEGTPPEYSKGELDEMKEPTVTYNDKEITQYEAEQKLRLCERNIRKYKREADGLQSAGLDNTAEKANVKKWQMTAANLCKQTGIRRDYVREYIGTKSGSMVRGAKYTPTNLETIYIPPLQNSEYVSFHVSDKPELEMSREERFINAYNKVMEYGYNTHQEMAIVLDRYGMTIGINTGDDHSVDIFTPEIVNQLKKQPKNSVTVIHNHPNGTRLSDADFETFITTNQIGRLMSLSPRGTYNSIETKEHGGHVSMKYYSERKSEYILKYKKKYLHLLQNKIITRNEYYSKITESASRALINEFQWRVVYGETTL